MNEAVCFAAYKKGGVLEEYKYQMEKLGVHDVGVKIMYCGICATDVGLIDDEYGWSKYPMVPGHEIVGRVEEVGENVKSLKIGDIVGIGPQRNCCHQCDDCLRGEENYCNHRHDREDVSSYGTNQPIFRGFARSLRVNEDFAFKIPDGIDLVQAGPLFCAGITVFHPIVEHCKPGFSVGILGMGGLGHLAIQFAKAWGCSVTVISSSEEKESDARSFGADFFLNSRNLKNIEPLKNNKIDFLMITSIGDIDFKTVFKFLKQKCKICVAGTCGKVINEEKFLSIPTLDMMMGGFSIFGTAMSNRMNIKRMLEIVAVKNIQVKIDSVFDFEDAPTAIERLRKGGVKYRLVLKM